MVSNPSQTNSGMLTMQGYQGGKEQDSRGMLALSFHIMWLGCASGKFSTNFPVHQQSCSKPLGFRLNRTPADPAFKPFRQTVDAPLL